MSQLSKGKSNPGDPTPAVFQHLSPSYSNASLPGASGSRGPTSALTSPSLTQLSRSITNPIPGSGGGLNIPLSLPIIPSLRSRESTRATDRTDALWAEMQATLEAVELSADGAGGVSGGGGSAAATARVFGPDHERKLDELRAAQIALAQAWARSEADEAIETTGVQGGGAREGGAGAGGMSEGRSAAADTAAAAGKSTAGTGSARPGSRQKEEETEVDILLARKRREANDRYFHRVNQGVLDVVAKLEEVAIAMRAVEQESKELWGDDTESVSGSAKA
ncbi:hypothetical protein NEMBOFW57_009964 [Staphylotrichum longicolle]|uniref:Uncharacterized protein n=1 Tax=Staphylotrichum longicolle TaxID=669026 RepID=A0AAD4EPY2_9PEZI|nr:hypothetical protein NEMBOFW57_009964 [Staphylotrichum longicolle]